MQEMEELKMAFWERYGSLVRSIEQDIGSVFETTFFFLICDLGSDVCFIVCIKPKLENVFLLCCNFFSGEVSEALMDI